MKRIVFLVLIFLFLLAACAATFAPPVKGTCAEQPQAGVASFMLDNDGQALVIVGFDEFCRTPVPVASGSEEITLVQVGVVTPSSVAFVVHGVSDGEGRLFWQVVQGTE